MKKIITAIMITLAGVASAITTEELMVQYAFTSASELLTTIETGAFDEDLGPYSMACTKIACMEGNFDIVDDVIAYRTGKNLLSFGLVLRKAIEEGKSDLEIYEAIKAYGPGSSNELLIVINRGRSCNALSNGDVNDLIWNYIEANSFNTPPVKLIERWTPNVESSDRNDAFYEMCINNVRKQISVTE